MNSRVVPLILGLLLVAGCASLPQVELEIARSEVARAYASGAKVLAPTEYEAASTALHEAELEVYRGNYARARKSLNQALLNATKAAALAVEKAEAAEAKIREEQRRVQEKQAKKAHKKPVAKKPVPPKPPSPKPAPPKPKIVLLDQVVVDEGETLFTLAGRKDIYADALLWPLIYKANRDQIKDPQQIFKGQVFTIPRDKSQQEQETARREALDSGLFRE